MNKEVQVSTASPEEIAQIIPVMGGWSELPTKTVYYAARDKASGEVSGAAALIFEGEAKGLLGATFQVCGLKDPVDPDLLRTLVQAMKVVARKKQADILSYRGTVYKDSPLEELLLGCHFEQRGEDISYYTTDVKEPAWERYYRSWERLKKRGKLEGYETHPLNKISVTPLAELMKRTIGSAGAELTREVLNPETCSIALLEGATVRGLHLVTVEGEKAHSPALVVDPEVRNSGVFTWLMKEVHERLDGMGVTEWSFKTNPGIHRSMENSGRKINARYVGCERSYAIAL